MVQKPTLIISFILVVYSAFLFYIIFSTKLTFYSDDAIYANIAKFFVERKWDLIAHPAWPPLYPLFSALFYAFFKSWEISSRAVSALSIILMLTPLYLLSKKIVGQIMAFSLILALILNSTLLKIAVFPQSDALAALFTISSFTFTFLALLEFKRYNKLIYLSSFLLGLSYLTRAEGSLFFIINITFISLFLSTKIILKQISIKLIIVIPVTIIIFFLTISPYVIPLSYQFGYPTLSYKFNAQIKQEHAFALKNNSTWAQEVTSIKSPNFQSFYFKGGIDYILDNFNILKIWYFKKIGAWLEIFNDILPLWFYGFALIGVLSLFRKKLFWPILYTIYTFSVAIPVTVFSTAIADIRYLIWTVPIFYFLYFMGWHNILKFLPNKNYLFFLPLFFSIFLPVTLNDELLHLQAYIKEFNQINYRPEILQVSGFLKSQNGSEAKIMARHEVFEFYSGFETIYIPQTNIDNLIQYAKKYHVDYIIVWHREIGMEKDFKPLFNINFENKNLEKIYQLETHDGPLIVYEVIKQI